MATPDGFYLLREISLLTNQADTIDYWLYHREHLCYPHRDGVTLGARLRWGAEITPMKSEARTQGTTDLMTQFDTNQLTPEAGLVKYKYWIGVLFFSSFL